MRYYLHCAVSAFLLLLLSIPAHANDYWWADGFEGVGLNSRVIVMTVDGTDLIVAGNFDHAGPVHSDQVARWDGNQWHSMSAPADWIEPFALGVYNGEVYGFGFGATALSKWDGGAWVPVGNLAFSGYQTNIRAMVEYQGELVIAGDRQLQIDGQIGYMTYDGSNFSGMGNGPELNVGPIVDMVVYDGDLYASGYFDQTVDSVKTSSVIRWDGMMWSPVEGRSVPAGPLLEGVHSSQYGSRIDALAVHDGKLVMAGFFEEAGDLPASNICTWDAATMMWGNVGSGSSTSIGNLAVVNGTLFAGGNNSDFGGSPIEFLAQWNGSTWSAVDGGVDNVVFDLQDYNGKLALGGDFRDAGGAQTEHLALWNGSSFENQLTSGGKGLDAFAFDLTLYDGDLVAVGAFQYAGKTRVNRVASWDGHAWSPFGDGTNDRVRSVLADGTDLIVAGDFTEAGGMPANYVARWDGNAWQTYGAGLPSTAYALCMHNGQLHVGGGEFAVGYLQRWDGSAWQTVPLAPSNREVTALTSWGGDLIASSNHWEFSGEWLFLARWDGSTWSPLLSSYGGIGDDTDCFYEYGGELYLGGEFHHIGSIPTSQHTGRWTGTELLTLDPSTVTFPPPGNGVDLQSANAFAEYDGRFFIAGNPGYNKGALWSSDMINPWEMTANDVNAMVRAMVPFQGRLYMAGNFTRTGCSRDLDTGTASSFIGAMSATPTGVKPPAAAQSDGRLDQNHPNPFNPTTAIDYAIPDGVHDASLVIYDLRGARVRTLFAGSADPGPGSATWDGLDDRGQRVASGIYFYRLEAGDFTATRKMVLLK